MLLCKGITWSCLVHGCFLGLRSEMGALPCSSVAICWMNEWRLLVSLCLVILCVCLYAWVETQLEFPLPGLGGWLQSGRMGRLHIGAVDGERAIEQAGAGLNGSPSRSWDCSAASSSLPACSVSLESRFSASLQWGGCAGGQGEHQVCTQFLGSFFHLPPSTSPDTD